MARFASLMAAAALVSSAAAAQYTPYPQPYSQPYPQPVPTYPYPGQTYPAQAYGQPYPGQPYGNDQSAIGAIIDGLIGNRYNVSDRQAIRQCAFAAVQRSQAYNGYNGYGGYGGYARVTAITDVERRTFGVRVRGMLASGRYGNQGYGYGGAYGRGDLSFRCDVDYRGYVRNVRLDPLVRRY